MSWIDYILPSKIRTDKVVLEERKGVPEGIWNKCPSCDRVLYQPELIRNSYVCNHCEHHLRIPARLRMDLFFDKDSYTELDANVKPVDKLKFKDTKSYKDRLDAAQKKTQEYDALLTATGTVKDVPIVGAFFNFGFLGGSMGAVVGEKFVRAVTYAMQNKRALVCFTASGGARMQESLFSLMQMAKVSAALAHMRKASLPYIVVLTDPTTGGVSASLAMLGDVHIAEPKALIGFAGPRVIEQTVREKLPEGFQRSEFLQEKGMVDLILDRRQLPERISSLLAKMLYYQVGDMAQKPDQEELDAASDDAPAEMTDVPITETPDDGVKSDTNSQEAHTNKAYNHNKKTKDEPSKSTTEKGTAK